MEEVIGLAERTASDHPKEEPLAPKEGSKVTRIGMIIDQSGSMWQVATAAMQGFNEFLRDQKQIGADAKVTLRLFNSGSHYINDVYSGPIDGCPTLNQENYIPDKGTALMDAIGDTLEKMLRGYEKSTDKPHVIICILTDGEERDSHLYTMGQVKDMIEKAKKYGWEFVFLGAGIHWNMGLKLGIDPEKVLDFRADKAGVKQAFSQITQSVSRLRLTGK